MPLYILCSQCEAVPVTRINELCEECQKRADDAQRRNDRRIFWIIKRLTTKPSRAAQERKAGVR